MDSIRGNPGAELAELVSTVPPAVEQEADELIEEADTANGVIEQLRVLIDQHNARELEDLISDAGGLQDLRSELREPQEGDTPEEPSPNGRSAFDRGRDTMDRGVSEVKQTFRSADPSESAAWGMAAGLMLGPAAVAAAPPTLVLLGLAAAGGASVGAYSSSRENTVLDGIDPMAVSAMAVQTALMGRTPYGRSVGSFAGGVHQILQGLAPEAYAQWITELDPGAVVAGAELGYSNLAQREEHTTRSGVAAGAGFGLLYGYIDGPDEQFGSLLDDELAEEARKRLSDGES